MAVAQMALSITMTTGTLSVGTVAVGEASLVSGVDHGQGVQVAGGATGGAGSQRGGQRAFRHIQGHSTQGGRMAEHVGVGGIG